MGEDGPNAVRSFFSLVPLSLKRRLIWELEGTTICRSRPAWLVRSTQERFLNRQFPVDQAKREAEGESSWKLSMSGVVG